MSAEADKVVLVLEADADSVPACVRLKRLLKRLGRHYGHRCLWVVDAPPVGLPLALPPHCCNAAGPNREDHS